MASIVERDGRWRALVRKAGVTRCSTFDTKAAAKAWATKVEREAQQLKASGVMAYDGTVADLIDRYVTEHGARKPWGISKTADLRRLRRDLGHHKAANVTSNTVTEYFEGRNASGAGGVVVSAQCGYLVGVLEMARHLWHLDVPLQAATEARSALSKAGMVGKSKRRDRRVTDAELEAVVAQIEKTPRSFPIRDVLQFCIASGMRISEVTRLQWSDLNEADMTIIVRDRKHPQDKIGNDMTVPLLSATGFDAFAIAKRQPRNGARIFSSNPRTVGNYVTDACAALGIKGMSLHDLRHEAISRLFEAGYSIQEVALVSGHRDWGMLKRYTHVRATSLHRAPVAAVAA